MRYSALMMQDGVAFQNPQAGRLQPGMVYSRGTFLEVYKLDDQAEGSVEDLWSTRVYVNVMEAIDDILSRMWVPAV
jgi:hypothetical protein